MFAKKESASKSIDTIISGSVVIKGDIISQGSVRVDGQIEGTINLAGDLIIGESGRINGKVKANDILLAGMIEGTLVAVEHFSIAATGKMQGDITCKLLAIDEGGQFEGSSCMSNRPEAVKQGNSKLTSKANIAGAGEKSGKEQG